MPKGFAGLSVRQCRPADVEEQLYGVRGATSARPSGPSRDRPRSATVIICGISAGYYSVLTARAPSWKSAQSTPAPPLQIGSTTDGT